MAVLRAGLAGCGSLALRGILPHLSLPDARAKVEVVAVADVDGERARAAAERFGIAAHFTELEAMLAGAELDLILIATPIPHHYSQAMAAIAAGKHVYVQKTLTTTLEEADSLLAARDRAGVKLAAAPGYELFPLTGVMREVVKGGGLGGVCVAYTYTLGFGHEWEAIRVGSGPLAEVDPSWYYRSGAGPLPDVTVYALQLATSVLGPVRRVTALANRRVPVRNWRGRQIPLEVEDNNVLLMEFVCGALGVAVGSDCHGSQRIPWGALGVYGTTGVLEVTDVDFASGYPLRFQFAGQDGAGEEALALSHQLSLTGEHLAMEEPHVYAEIMDLADAVLEDRPARAAGEQARHVVEIIERARIAAASGQTQELVSSFWPG
jgi:predicted dehydrogenase